MGIRPARNQTSRNRVARKLLWTAVQICNDTTDMMLDESDITNTFVPCFVSHVTNRRLRSDCRAPPRRTERAHKICWCAEETWVGFGLPMTRRKAFRVPTDHRLHMAHLPQIIHPGSFFPPVLAPQGMNQAKHLRSSNDLPEIGSSPTYQNELLADRLSDTDAACINNGKNRPKYQYGSVHA